MPIDAPCLTLGNLVFEDGFITRTAEERSRGLFVDYTASLKVSLAQLIVRYLLEEAPKHKSHQVLAYTLEGWLADSGPAGLALLKQYREELQRRKLPVRAGKFKMRHSSDELAWIHKSLSEVTTVDVENFISDRLEAVEPTVIAFPASRIVRGANGEPPAHVPRSDGVSQAPHAG